MRMYLNINIFTLGRSTKTSCSKGRAGPKLYILFEGTESEIWKTCSGVM